MHMPTQGRSKACSNLFVVSCITLVASFVIGCSSEPQSGSSMVIIKFVSHPALDATEEGLVAAVEQGTSSLPASSRPKIETYNANGSPQIAKQLAENADRRDVKVIVGIATPAAQAIARTPSDTPFVYVAVADPKGAGILETGRATGIANVGKHIIERALSFMRESFPQAKRLGTMYNPAEQNSQYVQAFISDLAPKFKFELLQKEVYDKTQVGAAAEALCNQVDLIYSANDNTVNASVASVVAVTLNKKVPFILGDLSTLEKGAFAAIGLEYRSMGEQAGTIAVSLLRGTPLSELPPRPAPEPAIWVNRPVLADLGLALPESAQRMVDAYKE